MEKLGLCTNGDPDFTVPRNIFPKTCTYAGLCTSIAILAIAAVEHHTGFDIIIASYGASAMIMFYSHTSPAAQPRSVLFGHVISGFVGVSVRLLSLLLDAVYPPLALASVSGLALLLMGLLCCVHPPGVATALVAYMETEGSAGMRAYTYIIHPVGSGVSMLVAIALVLNNLSPERRYPTFWY